MDAKFDGMELCDCVEKFKFSVLKSPLPLLEYDKHSQYNQRKTCEVIPGELFVFKEDQRKGHEDGECDGFLDGLQLDECKRAAIVLKASFISRDLKKIFKKSHAPADQYDGKKPQVLSPGIIFEF